MTTEKLKNFSIDDEETEIVGDFVCIGSVIHPVKDSSQELRRLGTRMQLEKIIECKDV